MIMDEPTNNLGVNSARYWIIAKLRTTVPVILQPVRAGRLRRHKPHRCGTEDA
jgi:hypothetical protein